MQSYVAVLLSEKTVYAAADAMDKLRFLSLSDRSILGEGEQAKLEVKISLDNDKKVLKIRDRGIGMTKQELVSNLGTIAKSGTSGMPRGQLCI